MIKSIKIKLEPNNKQETLLIKSANISRWTYNWALSRIEDNYDEGHAFMYDGELRKELTRLKQTEEYSWLYEVSSDVTKQAIKDAYDAYKRYFDSVAKHPQFKSKKKSNPSFYNDTSKIRFNESRVLLSKIGWVKLAEKGRVPKDTKYYNPRVKYDGVNWYLTVGVKIETESPQLSNDSVGIDVGVKLLAAVSNREEPYININKTPRVSRLKKKLRRLQRQLKRKYMMNKQGNKLLKLRI